MITRIITGLIGIALAAYVIQTGGTLFAGFALVLGLIAWFEYARAFGERGMGLTFLTGFLTVLQFFRECEDIIPLERIIE